MLSLLPSTNPICCTETPREMGFSTQVLIFRTNSHTFPKFNQLIYVKHPTFCLAHTVMFTF